MRGSGNVGILVVTLLGLSLSLHGAEETPLKLKASVTLTNPAVADQDDMCIWVAPEAPERSTVITSDKSAGKIFVYDLEGTLLQTVSEAGKPGNIDLRANFPLGEHRVALVGFNERASSQIHLYAVDSATRLLRRVDDGAIRTGLNYGFALYHSQKTDQLFAITVPEDGGEVEQYLLTANEDGTVSGKKVRSWPISHSEGCVADDRSGTLYIGEENVGIWRVGAEPDAPYPGRLVQTVGAHGLTADVEGLTIVQGNSGGRYLMASSQGSNEYFIYAMDENNTYRNRFSVEGAAETDGIDVSAVNFGPRFPGGLFALHNGAAPPHAVLLCDLRDLGLPLE